MAKIEIVEASCPSCSPKEAVTHTVIKDKLIKCEECGLIHRLPTIKEKKVQLKVIVSRQGISTPQMIEVNENDEYNEDDEFVVDAGDEVNGVQVVSIELNTAGRTPRAKAKDIRALWVRTIDEVVAKIAMQSGAKTESVDYKVNGDYEFGVGDVMKLKEKEIVISSIKTRDGRHVEREGVPVKAKYVKRVYSRILNQKPIKQKRMVGTVKTSSRGKKSVGTGARVQKGTPGGHRSGTMGARRGAGRKSA